MKQFRLFHSVLFYRVYKTKAVQQMVRLLQMHVFISWSPCTLVLQVLIKDQAPVPTLSTGMYAVFAGM